MEDEDWEKTSSRLRNAAMRRRNSRLPDRATRIDQGNGYQTPAPTWKPISEALKLRRTCTQKLRHRLIRYIFDCLNI
jgi:hypothetical protein